MESSDVEDTVFSLVGKKPDLKYPGKPLNYDSEVALFAKDFYSDENIESLISGKVPENLDPEDPRVSRQIKSLSRVAPIALSVASGLLSDVKTGSSLEDGLKLELQKLEEIFSTEDAQEGLSALIEGRRPKYKSS